MTKHRLYNFEVFFTASDVYSAEGHQLICLSGLCPRHFSWMDQLHNDAKNKKENIINEEKKHTGQRKWIIQAAAQTTYRTEKYIVCDHLTKKLDSSQSMRAFTTLVLLSCRVDRKFRPFMRHMKFRLVVLHADIIMYVPKNYFWQCFH